MKRVYIAILFVTLTAFTISGTLTTFTGNDFNQSVNNVKAYTEQSEQYFEQGLITLFGTAETVVTTVRGVTDFITRVITPLENYSILNLPDPTIVCIDYDDLPLIQQINLQSRRAFYNLFNSPNLTIEEYYLFTQIQRFGEAYNQVCV
jgi:hypothetical protein